MTVSERILTPGSVSVFTSDEDVYSAVITYIDAKEKGHAICYYETFEGGKFVCAHVLHYRSCKACSEMVKAC